MKPNSRAYNRDMSHKKALRKRRIAKDVLGVTYDNLHQYSKNKIHCSCPACSEKTRNKGSRRYKTGNYNRNINYKHSELQQQIAMDHDEKDYNNG